MMKALLCLSLVLTLLPQLRASDAELRRDLERVYASWKQAIVSRDATGWQQHTAAFRQMQVRNLIVSQRQAFPAALFAVPMRPPEIALLRFVKILRNGPTASAFYFGKVDLGLADPSEIPDNLLVLRYVNEGTAWKFDTTQLINLADMPEARSALQSGGSPAFLQEPALQPTGAVPVAAKPCQMQEHIGVLQIVSIGYETKANVNGFDSAKVQDNAEEHIIIGGLKSGVNPLTLEFKPLPGTEAGQRELAVNALVLTGNEKRPAIKVFSWSPESGQPETPLNLNIYVTRITMRE